MPTSIEAASTHEVLPRNWMIALAFGVTLCAGLIGWGVGLVCFGFTHDYNFAFGGGEIAAGSVIGIFTILALYNRPWSSKT